MSLGGEVLDQCSSLRGLAVPQVYKSKLARMGESCFLAQPNDFAVKLVCLALHAIVDPIDLDLEADGGKDRCRLFGPEYKGGADKADEKVGSVQKISSRKGRGIHV